MSSDELNRNLLQQAREIMRAAFEREDEFNAYFDGEDLLTVPSPTVDAGPYSYSRSEVLFWLDPDAYQDERAEWSNRTIQERHADALRLLHAIGCADEFVHLVEAVQRNRIVPFVGAGLSKPMELPLWGEALGKIRNDMVGFGAAPFDAAMVKRDYLLAAQLLFEHDRTAVTNFIKRTFVRRAAKGAVCSLPAIGRGCVITTNFDPIIEDVYRDRQRQMDGYMHGKQEHNFFSRLARGDRCLLKLHGDAESPATHVFTQSQYDDAYGAKTDFSRALPKALRQVFIGSSLLFVGCGLEEDRTLTLFQEVKGDHFEVPTHYAIVEEPSDPADKAKMKRRLLDLSIEPLFFPPTKYEFVQKLLSLLVDLAEGKLPMRFLEKGAS